MQLGIEQILANVPVALMVLGYLAWQDWRDGRFFNKRTPSNDIGGVIKQMGEQMSHLKVHFNDDITRILTDMQITLVKMTEKQDEYHKQNSDRLNRVLNNQDEAFTYGLPCRGDEATPRRKR